MRSFLFFFAGVLLGIGLYHGFVAKDQPRTVTTPSKVTERYSSPNPPTSTHASTDLSYNIEERSASGIDPEAILEQTLEQDPDSPELIPALLEDLAKEDLTAAWTWWQNHPEQHDIPGAFEGLLDQTARQDPQKALQTLLSQNQKQRKHLTEMLLDGGLNQSAKQLLESHSDPVIQQAVRRQKILATPSEELPGLLPKLTDPEIVATLVRRQSEHLLAGAPETFAQVLPTLPADDQEAYAGPLAEALAQQNPESARTFFQNQTNPATRDNIAATLALSRLTEADPSAFQWVAQISYPPRRREVLEQLYESWQATNPAALESALEDSGLLKEDLRPLRTNR